MENFVVAKVYSANGPSSENLVSTRQTPGIPANTVTIVRRKNPRTNKQTNTGPINNDGYYQIS